MVNYIWKHVLKDKGYNALSEKKWNDVQRNKCAYVTKYLSPSIHYARCGWDHCVYTVLTNQYGYIEEYVELCPNAEDNDGCYINVTGDSLGAIAESVWKNVFN